MNVFGTGAAMSGRRMWQERAANGKALTNSDGSAFISLASKKYATVTNDKLDGDVPESQWSSSTREYVAFIEKVAPHVIGQRIVVRVIDNDMTRAMGCLKWQSGIMLINLARIDTNDWASNFELFIHEMAHATVNNNDHLSHVFYETVTEVGAKLAQLAIERPELFSNAQAMAAD